MDFRKPTLNEQRCIIRHELGWYSGLLVAAIYRIRRSHSDNKNARDIESIFGPALRYCADRHPILRAAIDGPETEEPRFRRLQEVDLAVHLQQLSKESLNVTGDEEDELVEKAIEHVLNLKFNDVRKVPPWRMFVLPLRTVKSDDDRFLVVYSASHSHADGKSGLIFHKALLAGLAPGLSLEVEKKDRSELVQLPAAAGPFPVSWLYLLGTLVKEFTPWLHFWLHPSPGGGPWTGSSTFYDDTFKTATKAMTIDPTTLKTALSNWRPHGVKLTALLHIVIIRSLTAELRALGIEPGSLISSTAIDLRKAFRLPDNEMGVNATAIDFEHSAIKAGSSVLSAEIAAAQEQTRRFAHTVTTTQDHAVGLLEYARPIRKWISGKMGKSRETSYELSNVMVFDPDSAAEVNIERIWFAQPADAVGHPLSFNVVGLKDGNLEIVVCWQVGALLKAPNDGIEMLERQFVDLLAFAFEKEFEILSNGPGTIV